MHGPAQSRGRQGVVDSPEKPLNSLSVVLFRRGFLSFPRLFNILVSPIG